MFKLDTRRTYKHPVTVHFYDDDGAEQSGTFTATFKVLPLGTLDNEERILDHVLVAVEDFTLIGEDDKELGGDELLDAVKSDPAVSLALITAYNDSIVKKNLGQT